MSRAIYIGVDGVARKVKKMYIGVDGVAREIKKAYIGAPNFTLRDLPEGYTQIDYIQSSGTQYINTGFTPNQNSSCEVVMAYTEIVNANCGLFGAAGAGYTTDVFESYYQGGKFNFGFADAPKSVACTVLAGDRLTVKLSKSALSASIAGTVVSATPTVTNFTSPATFVIHALNRKGTVQYYSSSRCYGCRLWDNGTLVRDMVPCINPSAEVGMYDLVNGVFYGNAGTGVFVAGPTRKCVAKLVYKLEVLPPLDYTGTYTKSQVTIDGVLHDLYTVTKSGTLTLRADAKAWMCGGGAGGWSGSGRSTEHQSVPGSADGGKGGAGGYVRTADLTEGVYTVVIGAGGKEQYSGSASSISGPVNQTADGGVTPQLTSYSSYGGSGAGGARCSIDANNGLDLWSVDGGSGEGISTYPFGLTELYAHCGGGAGGAAADAYNNVSAKGGNGGTNGSNGSNGGARGSYTKGTTIAGGTGGVRGAGNGGSACVNADGTPVQGDGKAATFYGSGGGGGGGATNGETRSSTIWSSNGGAGYQGVMYIAIPA